jgi:hypothetical protein
MQVLRRHGMSDDAARVAIRVGDELRCHTQRTGVELAVMLDLATGDVPVDVIWGERARTDIGPHIAAMRLGQRYAHLHTHPRSSPFSTTDAGLFVAQPQIQVMVVVGADGTWYVLSDSMIGRVLPPSDIIDAYADELVALAPRYRELVASGVTDRQAADREGRHEALQAVARRFGLRYDRIERGTE